MRTPTQKFFASSAKGEKGERNNSVRQAILQPVYGYGAPELAFIYLSHPVLPPTTYVKQKPLQAVRLAGFIDYVLY